MCVLGKIPQVIRVSVCQRLAGEGKTVQASMLDLRG